MILTFFYSFRGLNAQKKVIDTYNSFARTNSNCNSAWCSETLSAIFIKAKATSFIGGVAQDAPTHVKHFKSLGIWKSGHECTPHAGDIVIFQDTNGKPNYTEIVFFINVGRGTFTAISGNYLGNVGLRIRGIHDKKNS